MTAEPPALLPPHLLPRPADIRFSAHVEHERSVRSWCERQGVALGPGQEARMIKFLDDWTRQ
jgi:hypothetical protein